MGKTQANHTGWAITSRVTAALIPAFILTNTLSIAISFVLPFDKIYSVLWVVLFSFVTYLCIVLWAFHVQSLKKLWLYLFLAIVVTSAISAGFVYMEKMQ